MDGPHSNEQASLFSFVTRSQGLVTRLRPPVEESELAYTAAQLGVAGMLPQGEAGAAPAARLRAGL
jgi:hypothetical protein